METVEQEHDEGGQHSPGWNIFARELAAILESQGLRLGHLNDRAGIHPERVRRLQRSLREPRFNVLPPDDLEHVIAVFALDDEQRTRLRAAILATAIEEMLMGRINARDAYEAADTIFPVLFRALHDYRHAPAGIGAIKEDDAPYHTLADDALDARLDAALDRLDGAILALHLARAGHGAPQAETTRRAHERMRAALAALEALPEEVRASPIWLIWHAEGRKGLASVERLLADEPGV